MMFCIGKMNSCLNKNDGKKILEALDYIISDLKHTGKTLGFRLVVMLALAFIIIGIYGEEWLGLADTYITLGALSFIFVSSLMKLSNVKRIKDITLIYLDDFSKLIGDDTIDDGTLRLRLDSLTRVYSNELEAINNIDMSTLLEAAFNKNKHDLHLILS